MNDNENSIFSKLFDGNVELTVLKQLRNLIKYFTFSGKYLHRAATLALI